MGSYESKVHYWQDVAYNGKRSLMLLWIRITQTIIKVMTQKIYCDRKHRRYSTTYRSSIRKFCQDILMQNWGREDIYQPTIWHEC